MLIVFEWFEQSLCAFADKLDRRDDIFEVWCVFGWSAQQCWLMQGKGTNSLFIVDHFCRRVPVVPCFLRCVDPCRDKCFENCWSVVLSLRHLLAFTDHWHHRNQYLNNTYSVFFMGGAAGRYWGQILPSLFSKNSLKFVESFGAIECVANGRDGQM